MKEACGKPSWLSGFVGKVSLFVFTLLLLVFYIIYLGRSVDGCAVAKDQLAVIYAFIQKHALCLFIALLFLPTFGVPISPLLIAAGALWQIKWALLISFVCIGFNLIFSYFFYRKWLNRFLFKLIFRDHPLRYPRPQTRLSSVHWVLLIQLIPHIPYAAQCYILSTLPEVHFWHYLGMSWIMQFAWAIGFVCSGQAILSGRFGLMIFLFGLLIVYFAYRKFAAYRKCSKPSC